MVMDLPPNGTLLRVGTWRIKGHVVRGRRNRLIALSVLFQAVQIGGPAALLSAFATIFAFGVFVRMPLGEIAFEQQGVKARTVWRTYQWRWSEIESFELREKGERPRFRICLRDGRQKGFVGFFTQSQAEEEFGQALFRAAKDRLEVEHKKVSRP